MSENFKLEILEQRKTCKIRNWKHSLEKLFSTNISYKRELESLAKVFKVTLNLEIIQIFGSGDEILEIAAKATRKYYQNRINVI